MSACLSWPDSPLQCATPDSSENLPTPTDSTTYLDQRCVAGIPPTSDDAGLSTSTDGSVYTDQEYSAAGSDGTIFSIPTDGSVYTDQGLPAQNGAGSNENYQNSALAPIHDTFDIWAQAHGRSLSNTNGDPNWAVSVMLRERSILSTPNYSLRELNLIEDLSSQPVPVYEVVEQVDPSGHHLSNTDIAEVGGGFSRTGSSVRLDESQNCAHLSPAEDGSRPAHLLNYWRPPTGNTLRSNGYGFSGVASFNIGHHRELDNLQGYPGEYGPPLPPIAVTRPRSGSSLSKNLHTTPARKKGVRNGRLTEKQRSDAACVRKLRACFPCQKLKQKCDPGPGGICKPCFERQSNPRVTKWFRGCDRSPMSDRYPLMLPGFIIGHHDDDVLKAYLTAACVVTVGSSKFQVKWTWGYGPPLETEMEEIYTKYGTSSSFRHNAEQGSHEHVQHDSVPLWISEEELKKMPGIVERHINGLVRRSLEGFPDFYHSETGGTKFQFNLLKLICRFHRTEFGKKRDELTRALELLVLIFFMGENLHLTAESRKELGRGQMWTWRDDFKETYPTPSIALRQLKQRLCPKLVERMKSVLDDLHTLCRRHWKKEWAITFAVLIIFSLICQDLQTSAMFGGIWEEKREKERSGRPYDYTRARECIKIMEDDGFDLLVEFFGKGYRNLNPLDGDFSDHVKMGFDKDSIAFIEDVRELLAAEAGKERDVSRTDTIYTVPPQEFAIWNVSRLVLRVLENPHSKTNST